MNTEIIVITDRSGSMSSLVADVIGGFNRFLKEQQGVPGEARMTYTQFDGEYQVVYQAKPLAEAPLLDEATFVPRGSTALYDAVGRTLNEQAKRIHDEGWAELVVVQIITDGGENASREYTREKVFDMMKHVQDKGWKVLFLAANQDAFATGASLGIAGSTTANYNATKSGTAAAYGATSMAVTSMRSAPGLGLDVSMADLMKGAETLVNAT